VPGGEGGSGCTSAPAPLPSSAADHTALGACLTEQQQKFLCCHPRHAYPGQPGSAGALAMGWRRCGRGGGRGVGATASVLPRRTRDAAGWESISHRLPPRPCWEAGGIPHKMVLLQRGGTPRDRGRSLANRDAERWRRWPSALPSSGAARLRAGEAAGVAAATNAPFHIKQASVT